MSKKQVRLFKWFTCVGFAFMLFSHILKAHADESISHVIDTHHILNYETAQRINKVLIESSHFRKVDIFVFIVKVPLADTNSLAKDLIMEWNRKNKDNSPNKKKAYLILNVASAEGIIQLAENTIQDPVLLEGLNNIQKGIISPKLSQGNIEQAAFEGSIALSYILEDWLVPKSNHYNLSICVLRWLGLFGVLYAGWIGIRFCFRNRAPRNYFPL